MTAKEVRELALKSFDLFRSYAKKQGIYSDEAEAKEVKNIYMEVIKDVIKDE